MSSARLRLSDARLYQTLRTAHLERAHELAPASILYRVRRYDFDEGLIAGLDLVQASPLRAAALLARSGVVRLEVNEPLMLQSLPATVLALLGLRARRLLGGPRATVVSYAIGNDDPFTGRPGRRRLRSRLRRRLDVVLARAVWRRVDRVVFGTDEARTVYSRVLGPARTATTIPALPSAHADSDRDVAIPESVVFLGALMERKGIRVLLDAWPLVTAKSPAATLLVLGKGPLRDEVERAVARDPSIRFEHDPSRDRIHAALGRAEVLALPSQPSPTWREQVGLPIVEGLSHGCRIVTTDQTGLADWLREHGHSISGDARSPEALAVALGTALAQGPSRAEVLASLPERDGRLLADDWLFDATDSPALTGGSR